MMRCRGTLTEADKQHLIFLLAGIVSPPAGFSPIVRVYPRSSAAGITLVENELLPARRSS